MFEVFSWHRGGAQWRLSRATALLLSSYALAVSSIAGWIGGLAWQLAPDEWWVAPKVALQTATLFVVAAAAFGYIFVGFKAVRSSQVHLNGVALLATLTMTLWYIASDALSLQGECGASFATYTVAILLWALAKAALFMTARQKMVVLGPQTRCCLRPHQWGSALIASTALLGVVLAIFSALKAVLVFSGFACEENLRDVLVMGKAVEFVIVSISGFAAIATIVAGIGAMCFANILRRRAVSKLVERKVQGEELTKVRTTLGRHVLGMSASICSTLAFMFGNIMDSVGFLGDESQETFVIVVAAAVDIVGDVVGILLLSGIGVLFLHEDPEAGDISSHIHGILHSAVLTSQAEMAFEGSVDSGVRTGLCVASFPGKCFGDWHSLTWACEQGDLGSACVFLPKNDPQQRFGKHAENPDTPGKCWCHTIYGEKKDWGCLWFTAWVKNIELAAELKLELLVVFFPGQVGKGLVHWNDLGIANLWDGVGLGGSQKCEVAFLRMRGLNVTEIDLAAFRQLCK